MDCRKGTYGRDKIKLNYTCPSNIKNKGKKKPLKFIGDIIYGCLGNSLVIQWLGLCTFTTKGLGSIPGWGTKIPQAPQWSKKKNHHHLKHEVKKRIPITEILFQNISYRSGLKHNIQVTYHFQRKTFIKSRKINYNCNH